ncbi:MAG: glycosyltransferase family 39 protein [Burkholderiales bacterium]|nr:glycosyltransferase family 39 protein [Burkholderiales bacterium]
MLSVLVVALRFRYLNEPFDNDITIRMSYAMAAIHGAAYYSDLFVFGPPGGLWVNELFVRLLGGNEYAVFAMGASCSLMAMWGIAGLALRWSGSLAALVAAATWAALSIGISTEANQPNAEAYVMALMVWGFVLLQQPSQGKHLASWPWAAVAAGLLFFLATAVKHHMVFMPLCAFLAHGLIRWRAPGGERMLKRWLIAGTVVGACWAGLLTYYALTGRLGALWDGLVGHSLAYAAAQGGVLANLNANLAFDQLVPEVQRGHLLLYALLLVVVVAGVLRQWLPAVLIMGWSLGTWVAISLPGRGYPHYYLLWYPLLSIATGLALGFIVKRYLSRRPLLGGVAAGVVIAMLMGAKLTEVALVDAEAAVRVKYGRSGGGLFSGARVLGLQLRDLKCAQTIMEFGASGLHFWAGCDPPMPFVDSLYAAPGQFPDKYREAMVANLVRQPPHWVVVRRSFLGAERDDPRAVIWREVSKTVAYEETRAYGGAMFAVFERKDASAAAPQ